MFVRSLKERYGFGSCRGGWVQQSLHYGRRDCRKAEFNALLMHSETPFLPLLRPPSTIDKAWPWKRDECARRRPVDFQAPLFLHRPSSFPLARGSNASRSLPLSLAISFSVYPSLFYPHVRRTATLVNNWQPFGHLRRSSSLFGRADGVTSLQRGVVSVNWNFCLIFPMRFALVIEYNDSRMS